MRVAGRGRVLTMDSSRATNRFCEQQGLDLHMVLSPLALRHAICLASMLLPVDRGALSVHARQALVNAINSCSSSALLADSALLGFLFDLELLPGVHVRLLGNKLRVTTAQELGEGEAARLAPFIAGNVTASKALVALIVPTQPLMPKAVELAIACCSQSPEDSMRLCCH